MRAIQYAAPTTVDAAVALLSEHGGNARILAGGTDLIVQVREDARDTELFVDAKGIPEMMGLAINADGTTILGAATPCYELYQNAQFCAAYPAVVDAARIIGSTGIQGRASVGGNLCNSGPAGDSIPALIVHSAICNVAGPNGPREIAVEDFCTAPGRNILELGEMLVSLTLPAPPPDSGTHYLRFIPRNEMDIAVVGAGAFLQLDRESITAARIALGAVAPTPLFVKAAGEALIGQTAGEAAFATAAEIARDTASPIDDMRGTVAHRKQLSYVLTQRALRGAMAHAQGGTPSNGH